ncbi:MAG: DUF6049 family protein, partial [Nocardioidaceae bacterium]
MTSLRRAAVALAVLLTCVCAPVGTASYAGQPARHSTDVASPVQDKGDWKPGDPSELTASIDSISPFTLQRHRPLQLTGTITNHGGQTWGDLQVYLEISPSAATTRQELKSVAEFPDDETFASPVETFGLFDQIGDIGPHDQKRYHLSIPYKDLPINGAAGVYHVGAVVWAYDPAQYRAVDARADSLVAQLPHQTKQQKPAKTEALVPFTAPITRLPGGAFRSEQLGKLVAPGGRLRNLLEFASGAPDATLQLAVDPAVLAAVEDMSNGYDVISLREDRLGKDGSKGTHQQDAADWLEDFKLLRERQHVLLLPWGDPAVNALAANDHGDVVRAAVRASTGYAKRHHLTAPVVGWPANGMATRRALSVLRQAGAAPEIVSESSLSADWGESGRPPPARTSISSGHGLIDTVVSRRRLAGEQLTTNLTAQKFRQYLVADATIRSLNHVKRPSVIAMPFAWDPGPDADAVDLIRAFDLPVLTSHKFSTQPGSGAHVYRGRVQPPRTKRRSLSQPLLEALDRLHQSGSTLRTLLTGSRKAGRDFRQDYAMAGSNAWRWAPRVGTALVRRQAADAAEAISKVTVSGPPFVAMSSDSGKFPITL